MAKPDYFASREVAEYLTLNDPEHLRGDLSHNKYGKDNCPPSWLGL